MGICHAKYILRTQLCRSHMPEVKYRKIINDPVLGFITIDDARIYAIIAHPYYQRLRRIRQMALASMVYPGAVHTRLHHSLGAYHLMCIAVSELRAKNVEISEEEAFAVKAAILLHDIGHGPFSHALEHSVIAGVSHEWLSLQIMQLMNKDMGGALSLAIEIFTGKYSKPFLHQLISGQVDMDRLDYLSRDSFFTGVSEGVVGYDRILKMLAVHKGELMIEEKGIYSVEKFLIARRQMYWQVYLHKTVLSAEKMLVQIMQRARELTVAGDTHITIHSPLDFFMQQFSGEMNEEILQLFCQLDDNDVIFAVKSWSRHPDKVLSTLSLNLLNRKLLRCKIQSEPFEEAYIAEKLAATAKYLNLTEKEAAYFVFTGAARNVTYKPSDEKINILFKNGKVKDISKVDNALISKTMSTPVEKFYICFPKGVKTEK